MAKRATARRAATPRRATRRRRFARKHQPHLPAIARLFVASGYNKSATARAARATLGLASFKADLLRQWLEKDEFRALVRQEEQRQAAEAVASPFVRGPKHVAWLLALREVLTEACDRAVSRAAKQQIFATVTRISDEIRAEERFIEDLRQRAARRDFGRFMLNVIKAAKREGEALAISRYLRKVVDHLHRYMDGTIDAVADDSPRAAAS